MTLSWSASSDAETPAAGLSYNLRVGTTPGGSEITSPMANTTSGYRRIVQHGNAQQRTSWIVTVPPGTYYWTVQAVDGTYAGSPFAAEELVTPSSVEGHHDPTRDPASFALLANVPNPFNPLTTISFDLPVVKRVELAVYDVSGRRVRVLLDHDLPPGRHDIQWNGINDRGERVASGVYFCRIDAGAFTATRTMTLAK